MAITLLASFLVDKPVFSSALRDDDLRYTRLAEVFLPRPSLFPGVYPLLSRDNQRQIVRQLMPSTSATWPWVMPPATMPTAPLRDDLLCSFAILDTWSARAGYCPGNDLCTPLDRSGSQKFEGHVTRM